MKTKLFVPLRQNKKMSSAVLKVDGSPGKIRQRDSEKRSTITLTTMLFMGRHGVVSEELHVTMVAVARPWGVACPPAGGSNQCLRLGGGEGVLESSTSTNILLLCLCLAQ